MRRFYNFFLKLTLLSLLIGYFTTAGFAATYYVSNTGNDANSGLSSSLPWKSISKVNSMSFMAGDQILFQRGNSFYGTLINNSGGTAGSPITYGAYGTGEKPIITGFTVITGWTNEGGGIYSKVITSESPTNMVTVDGVNTAMGRYPNSSYLIYESCNGSNSITDNELGTTTNWTGAEAVIRKNDWTLDRCLITNHSGGTLTYSNKGTSQNATANFGYFIQNDLRTLDQLGEWYHNTSTGKFYMYFGSIDPNTKTVKVATLKNVIYNMNSNGNYITLDNLSITGSISNAITLPEWYTQFNTIQNCDVSFSGAVAIYSQAANTSVSGNVISDCANMGVYINRDNTKISNNRMFNIGMVEGQSLTGANNAIHLGNADNSVTEYNVLENIGYDGIFVTHGTNIKVKNNFINNVCMILNDGGGIYTGDPSTNFIIDGNIILNSVGNAKGRNGNSLLAEGIYLDEYAGGITVKNNTTVNCSNAGIKLHKGSNNIIRNNVSYNNAKGIDFFNSLSNWSMSGNYMAKNIFFAKTSIQQALNFTTMAQDGCKFGVADSNYYVRPIKDDTSIQTYEPNNNTFLRTLSSWQSYSSQDAH
ncbi:MAG: right-handed parallel beta-helix repeat-containing protein, partial [Clostridiales bacterium]